MQLPTLVDSCALLYSSFFTWNLLSSAVLNVCVYLRLFCNVFVAWFQVGTAVDVAMVSCICIVEHCIFLYKRTEILILVIAESVQQVSVQ